MSNTVTFTPIQNADTLTWFSWNFGDGAFDGGPQETHVFDAAGSYSVTLSVSNGCGVDEISFDINILDGPFADNKTKGCDLWVIDGDSAHTKIMLPNFSANYSSYSLGSRGFRLLELNNKLYFFSNYGDTLHSIPRRIPSSY